jgi:hypothetical protein
MWMTRMSTATPALSLDHCEPAQAAPPQVGLQPGENDEGCAAQQAAITHGSATPAALQDGDDSTAGDP